MPSSINDVRGYFDKRVQTHRKVKDAFMVGGTLYPIVFAGALFSVMGAGEALGGLIWNTKVYQLFQQPGAFAATGTILFLVYGGAHISLLYGGLCRLEKMSISENHPWLPGAFAGFTATFPCALLWHLHDFFELGYVIEEVSLFWADLYYIIPVWYTLAGGVIWYWGNNIKSEREDWEQQQRAFRAPPAN